MTSGYSGTPLPKKLGVKEGTRLALIGAPAGFAEVLGELPVGARVSTTTRGEADVILLFQTRFAKLNSDFRKAAKMMPPTGGMLWVAWPKKASKLATDLDFDTVQKHGLSTGLVDTKICAVDETWSALRFSRRRAK